MYIYTQDKKKLLRFEKLSVEKNTFGSANEKYCITATGVSADFMPEVIGYYPDERSAMNELANIYMAMNMGNKLYEVH